MSIESVPETPVVIATEISPATEEGPDVVPENPDVSPESSSENPDD